MANNNETTTKFKVDISELVSGMQDAKRQIALANAEFRSATAGMDDWSKSADGVSAKISQLDETLSSQTKILDNLEEQYRLTAEQMGEGSKEAQNLKIKIENQKAAIAKTQKELNSMSDTLDDVTEAERIASRTGRDVSEVLDEMADSAEDAGDGFTILKGAVATFAGNLATQAVGGIKNMISSVAGLADSTREYREDIGKLQTAFSTAGHTTEQATKTYKDLFAVFGEEDRAVEASQQIAMLAKSEEEMVAMTNIATGVWGTFGDSLPAEALMETINSTSKIGTVQGNLADALEWSGVNLDEFNASLSTMSTEEEKSAYIIKTLNGLYGEASDKYKETNASIMAANKAQSDYTDSMAQLGAKTEPIMTAVKQGFADILAKVLELVEGVDFNKLAEGVKKGFDHFINETLPKIIEGLNWIKDNKDTIIAGIAGIGAAFVAWKVVSIITAVTNAIKGMTVAQAALNGAMSLNPIGLVVAAIAALVAAFIYLWNNCEEFREFWINLWEGIKEITGKVVGAIGDFFSGLWDGIKKVFSGVGKWFGEQFTKAKENTEAAWSKTKEWASKTWGNIKEGFANVGGWFKEQFTKAKENRDLAWSKTKEWASNTWSSISGAFGKAGSFFKDTFGNAWTNVKNAFSSVGSFFGNLWSKIVSKFTDIGTKIGDAVGGAFKSIVNSVLGTAERIINGFFKLINGAVDIINKVPNVNISKIKLVEFPRLATGGVLRKGQTGYLEGDGDEAVVPLDKNTGWLDEVASRIVAKGGLSGGKPQTVNNNYNYDFKQTNNSPKSLSRLEIYRQTKNQISLLQMGGAVNV